MVYAFLSLELIKLWKSEYSWNLMNLQASHPVLPYFNDCQKNSQALVQEDGSWCYHCVSSTIIMLKRVEMKVADLCAFSQSLGMSWILWDSILTFSNTSFQLLVGKDTSYLLQEKTISILAWDFYVLNFPQL